MDLFDALSFDADKTDSTSLNKDISSDSSSHGNRGNDNNENNNTYDPSASDNNDAGNVLTSTGAEMTSADYPRVAANPTTTSRATETFGEYWEHQKGSNDDSTSMKEKAQDKASDMQEKASEWSDKTRDKSSDLANTLRDKASGMTDTIKAKSDDMANKVSNMTDRAKDSTKSESHVSSAGKSDVSSDTHSTPYNEVEALSDTPLRRNAVKAVRSGAADEPLNIIPPSEAEAAQLRTNVPSSDLWPFRHDLRHSARADHEKEGPTATQRAKSSIAEGIGSVVNTLEGAASHFKEKISHIADPLRGEAVPSKEQGLDSKGRIPSMIDQSDPYTNDVVKERMQPSVERGKHDVSSPPLVNEPK